MTRKEWLKTFLDLADQNRPAREFRVRLGIGLNVLGNHVKSLGAYREELREIVAVETREAVQRGIDQAKALLFVPGPKIDVTDSSGVFEQVFGTIDVCESRDEIYGPSDINA